MKLWPLGRATASPSDEDDAEETARKLADKVLSLIADGEVSRAAHLLQTNGVADATNATDELLRDMLSPNPAQQAPGREWTQRRRAEAAGVSHKALLQTLREAGKGGAADLAGWHHGTCSSR